MTREGSDERSRRSIRLAGYDYSQAGYYFVTVCVNNRELLLGEIKNDCRGTVCCAPNKYGAIVCEEWKKLSQRFPNIELGEFIIMPNHIHMIIIVGAGSSRPLNVGYGNGAIGRGDRAPTLGQIRHILNMEQRNELMNYETQALRNFGSGIIMNILSVMITI